MTDKVQAIPRGYHSVTPNLFVAGAASALEFYKKALGAQELSRYAGPDGKLMHSEMKIGDSILMVVDEMPHGGGGKGPKAYGGSPISLFLYTENVDSAWKRAVDAGAKPLEPLIDQFWGDRAGLLQDPYGHYWWLAQRKENLTPDQLRERAEDFFAQPHNT